MTVSADGVQWNDISDWLAWWLAEPRLSPESQRVFDRYYSSYKHRFSPWLRRHYASQTEEAQALIGRGTRVLEVGCGCGTESLWFAMLGASVVGVDLNEPRLEVARERARYLRHTLGTTVNAEFLNTSLFDLVDGDGFDLIWMEQAYHHVEPRKDVPAKLLQLLRPGGHVVISEANGWNPMLQLMLLRQRGFKTIREHIDDEGQRHLYGVERITTGARVGRHFAAHGFKPVSLRYFRVLPNVACVERLAWIEPAVPRWLLPAFTHYNVVLRRGG